MRLKPGPGPGSCPVTRDREGLSAGYKPPVDSPELRTAAGLGLCTALFAPLVRAVLGCCALKEAQAAQERKTRRSPIPRCRRQSGGIDLVSRTPCRPKPWRS